MNLTNLINVTNVADEETAYQENALEVFKYLISLLTRHSGKFEDIVIISGTEEIPYANNLSSKLCHSTRVILSGAGVEFKFSFCKAINLIAILKENGYIEINAYHWEDGHFISKLKQEVLR